MHAKIEIGLVGDHDVRVAAHRAIPVALALASEAAAVNIEFRWIPTDAIHSTSRVSGFDGLWCVPASPYRSMEGALLAIQYAREHGRPFLGTCGGFQHAVVEYARNVLGWADAEHAETAPDAARPVVTALACALVETAGTVQLYPESHIARAYGTGTTTEGYHCRYGLNPAFQAALVSGLLRAVANDGNGEVRAIELDDHPFFVATLFQPERAALVGRTPPLVAAFALACASHAAGGT